MDASAELAQFLTTRRAAIAPEQAGLPSYGRRQVPGLRREEVASLAGVSVEYYKRLERGNASGASDSVLEALAAALRLDDAERAPLFESREQPANAARFTFLDPVAQDFYVDWEHVAKEIVGTLRTEAAHNPYDKGLTDLIGELSTRSEPFRTWWAAHNVRFHQAGAKRLNHPIVGELEITYEVLELAADNGLTIAVFSTEAGSRSEEALSLLSSWAAAPGPTETDDAHRPS